MFWNQTCFVCVDLPLIFGWLRMMLVEFNLSSFEGIWGMFGRPFYSVVGSLWHTCMLRQLRHFIRLFLASGRCLYICGNMILYDNEVGILLAFISFMLPDVMLMVCCVNARCHVWSLTPKHLPQQILPHGIVAKAMFAQIIVMICL